MHQFLINLSIYPINEIASKYMELKHYYANFTSYTTGFHSTLSSCQLDLSYNQILSLQWRDQLACKN
ncbi:unnamed protein product [Blepharisma stoltei]|uniref:Uncharacterized protein n=1 Tax=Blepharisma stoltei TaxID=1481888 RepID=A0AAU9JSA7_9CILI|nr:unnamed protein product [Blepharisma stoltei]